MGLEGAIIYLQIIISIIYIYVCIYVYIPDAVSIWWSDNCVADMCGFDVLMNV